MTVTREQKVNVPPPPPAPPKTSVWRWLLPALGIVLWVLIAGVMSGPSQKISEVQKNDNSSFLPKSAESTWVLDLNKKFTEKEIVPTLVVYSRDGKLTDADKAKIVEQGKAINDHLGAELAQPPIGPIVSADGQAAQLVLMFAETDAMKNAESVKWIRAHIGTGDGLTAHVGGLGGLLTDFMDVFDSIDGLLLYVALGVILLILLVVYRSPLLPFVVLFGAGFAYTVANGVVYLLAKQGVIDVSGQSQAILNVLVLGASTDYAMLIVSRFREELRTTQSRFEAMRIALRASFEPILASGATVILGLLCLLVSDLSSNKGLGPVGAIGVAASLLVALTLLPAVLALLGRAAFWPVRPKYGSAPAEQSGIWGRISTVVGKRARLVWAVTAAVLIIGVLGLTRLQSDGIPQSDTFTSHPDSVSAQEVLAAHFDAGSGSPAEIMARQEKLPEVLAAVKSVKGVAQAAPYTGATAMPVPGQPLPQPKVVNGFVRIDAVFADAADTSAARETLERLRPAVHSIAGADAKVGGFTAINYDVQATSQHDRKIIIPLVLGVIFLILMVLLRSLIAPLVLIATVVLSYLATLGISGFVFRDLFGFPGTDSSFPLFAFVFLVALGVDYNIFLMTRVREEAGKVGHTRGTLRGLAVTGGVITSAGVVLAATFAALAVMPMVPVIEIAFAVAFGVLLDTLLVRSLLVPALTVDIGRKIWWPGKLSRTEP